MADNDNLPDLSKDDDQKGGPSLKLDDKVASGFCSYFHSLPEKEDTLVRFFDRKDYYSIHGEDAKFIALTYYHSLNALKTIGAGKLSVSSICVSSRMFETIIRDLLLERNFRVEVYACPVGQPNQWSCVRQGSPGNIQAFEEVLFNTIDMDRPSVIIACRTFTENETLMLAVGFADAVLRKIGITQFQDNTAFSNLESVLVQMNVCEAVISDTEPQAKGLQAVFERCSVVSTKVKPALFATRNTEQDIATLVGSLQTYTLQMENSPAPLACLGCLIRHLTLLRDEGNHGRFSLSPFDFNKFMRLDATAMQSLNILPQPGDLNKTVSLLGLLNNCHTSMGTRLLQRWLKQPLLDVAAINERLDLVEVFVTDVVLRQSLQADVLRRVPDVERLVKKFQLNKATLADVVKVYHMVCQLHHLEEAFNYLRLDERLKNLIKTHYAEPLGRMRQSFQNYLAMTENTIDFKNENTNEFFINPKFDDLLGEFHEEMQQIRQQIQDSAGKVARVLGLDEKKVKLDRSAQFGYFYRVSRKDEKFVRTKRNFTTLDARKDGVKFTDANLRILSDRYNAISEEYESRQTTLVNKVLEIARSYLPVITEAGEMLAEIDVFVAFAHVSVSGPQDYVRPTVLDRSDPAAAIELTACRHPCLEVQSGKQFIPNDVSLKRDGKRFHLITGPNMGGKSTYIRSVALVVLMAQIGCWVPCAKAVVTTCDSIRSRVGAGDSQIKGVSTFMAEMLETSSILRASSPHSLLIIDELGRGTSTSDGFGLAWAISEYIVQHIGAFCLFATHFHELTILEKHIPQHIGNLHVSAHTSENELTLLYKVNPGSCDQSFGIHVAELARFPPEVVEAARRKADELENTELAEFEEKLRPAKRQKIADYQHLRNAVRNHLHAVRLVAEESALSPERKTEKIRELTSALTAKNPQLPELIDQL
eukprot:GCRY01001619.1.p1 GENE.GCRY01001619.1~~GCRY01001619.1.p1  ORF type:complete len:982 (-),score=325.54 GCRY01001619.1:227-3022(-)